MTFLELDLGCMLLNLHVDLIGHLCSLLKGLLEVDIR